MPSRRKLVSALATGGAFGSAGCMRSLGLSVRTPTIEVVETTLPQQLEQHFRFDVSVVEQYSRTQPGRIRISVHHRESAEAPRSVEFGDTPPFSNYIGGSVGEERHLLIAIPEATDEIEAMGAAQLDPDDWVPEQPDNGCWRTPAVPGVDTEARTTVEISPGDSVEGEYRILDFAEGDCLSAGEYVYASSEPYVVSRNGEVEWRNSQGTDSAMRYKLRLT